MRLVVGHLYRRTFCKIGGGRVQCATDAAIERKFATTDAIDRYAGRVWRIFDGKFHIDFHRHGGEEYAFHAVQSTLVIELTVHVIARAYIDIFVGESLSHNP